MSQIWFFSILCIHFSQPFSLHYNSNHRWGRERQKMFHLMLALIIMFVTNHHFLLDWLFHVESYTMNWMRITSMRSITPHFSARKPQQNNNKLVPIYQKNSVLIFFIFWVFFFVFWEKSQNGKRWCEENFLISLH